MIPEAIVKHLHDAGFRSIEEGKCSICGTVCLSCIHPEDGLGSMHPEDANGKICEGFTFVASDPPISYKDPEPEPPLVLRHEA